MELVATAPLCLSLSLAGEFQRGPQILLMVDNGNPGRKRRCRPHHKPIMAVLDEISWRAIAVDASKCSLELFSTGDGRFGWHKREDIIAAA